MIMHGIASHHLLPCCAAKNASTQEITANTKLKGVFDPSRGRERELPK